MVDSASIPIIDLFAGPGGLGEGFSAFAAPAGSASFRIALSIEMERWALSGHPKSGLIRRWHYGASFIISPAGRLLPITLRASGVRSPGRNCSSVSRRPPRYPVNRHGEPSWEQSNRRRWTAESPPPGSGAAGRQTGGAGHRILLNVRMNRQTV